MNPTSTTPRIDDINTMEPSTRRALMSVLRFHIGRENAIGRFVLRQTLVSLGWPVSERTMREEIKGLRREGWLICAMPGEDGGYYLAETLEEFREFDRLEFGAKIADMNETRQALLKAARERFGEAVQPGLL